MQQETEERQKLWNQFGHANFMVYCRAGPCPQLDRNGAGIAGPKPYYLEFKKIDYFSTDLRN